MTHDNGDAGIDVEEIRRLAGWLSVANIHLFEMRWPGGLLRLRFPHGANQADRPTIVAASNGIFHTRHPLRVEPFVQPPAPVTAGEIVGLLQVSGIYIPITAPSDCLITGALVKPGAIVAPGTSLFSLEQPVGTLSA